jgi:transposase-like protein
MHKYGSAAYKETLNKKFAPTIKRSAVRAVTEGRLTPQEAKAAYGVKYSGTINRWMDQFDLENDELSVFTPSMAQSKKQKESLPKDLQADNEALKKALEEAQLKVAALNTLIDVAEEQLKINIRKKPGAKQS